MNSSQAQRITGYNPTSSLLDTVPLTSESDTERLTRLQARKAVTKEQIYPLLALNSTLVEAYERTSRCAEDILLQEHTVTKENRMISWYCGKRWCSVCSAQKTANLTKGYWHAIEAMQNPMFVTLTVVAVSEHELKHRIKSMSASITKIKDRMRKRGMPLNGIRKVESNVNVEAQTYNPHYHFVVDGEVEANMLREEWLKSHVDVSAYHPSYEFIAQSGELFHTTINPEAQQVKVADEGSLVELFKYVSKSIVGKRFHAKEQDVINRAFLNVRAFQPFGNVRKASETSDIDINDEDAILDEDSTLRGEYRTIARCSWIQGDTYLWVCRSSGEVLCDMKLSNKALRAVNYTRASNRLKYIRTG
jgi:hypothetical protein